MQIPETDIVKSLFLLDGVAEAPGVSRCGGDTQIEAELCFMLWGWASEQNQNRTQGEIAAFSALQLFSMRWLEQRES